jgi:hypothetical protein
VLELTGYGNTVNTDNFPGLKDIIQADVPGGNSGTGEINFSVTGMHSVNIYLGDLVSTNGNDWFDANLTGTTGNDTLIGGNDNGDIVTAGAGHDHVTLGNGNKDQVTGWTGTYQTFTVGTGTGDVVYGGSGDHQSFTANGQMATFVGGSGNYQSFSGGNGQGDAIYGGSGSYDVLNGSTGGNDTITERAGGNQTAIAHGTFDVLTAGTGENDVLQSTFANTTFNDLATDDAMINLTIKGGTGANDVFNVGNNMAGTETVNGKGVGDLFNVGMGSGDLTINTNKTGTVNFVDSWTNATVTKDAVSGWDIFFADTNATCHVTGVNQATFAGVVHMFG